MKKAYSLYVMLTLIISISFWANASNNEAVINSTFSANDLVTGWAQNTLLETLSVSYLQKHSETHKIRKKYSHAAWEPMHAFFHHEHKMIKEHRLILHPKPLTKPIITKVGECFEHKCWRINQSVNIPELYLNIEFSLLILKVSPVHQTPFLIQSVNMKVHRY